MRMSSFSCLQQLQLLLILFSVVSTTQAQEFPGFGGGGGGSMPCPPHRCPKDQEPVPKWPLRLTSTGCSGLGGGLQMMSPGSMGDQNDPKDLCCDLRHACFQTCGSVKTVCDEEFSKCTKRTCAAMVNEEQRKKCESSSSIHELMISMDKCRKYSAAQSAHCECVPTSRAPSRRTQVLEKFYKKYNPESIDKVPGLMAKVDSGRKMAGLLMQLYKKYPHAIKKMKDPTQEMMEKIMKDAEKVEENGSRQQGQDDVPVEESDAEDLGVDEL